MSDAPAAVLREIHLMTPTFFTNARMRFASLVTAINVWSRE